MTPVEPGAATAWTYALLTDTDDDAERERRVQTGDGWVALVRWVIGGPEQLLLPEGSWRDTQRLAAIRQRGAMEWTTELAYRDAERTVEHWLEIGRLHAAPELDEQPAPPVRDQAVSRAEASRLAAELAARNELDGAEADRARTQLLTSDDVLTGSYDLASGWCAVPGRVTALSRWPADLSDVLDRARKGRAFAETGAQRLWALETRRSFLAGDGPPRAAWAPLSPDWLAGVSILLGSAFEGVLTTPSLDCAILQTAEFGVIGGSRAFVETVLDMTLEAATEQFVAYARGETAQPPSGDLSLPAERYLGREAADAVRSR